MSREVAEIRDYGPCVGATPLPLFERVSSGVCYPHPSLTDAYTEGCTEPWIVQTVCALLAAAGGRTVLELGAFIGVTSAWLALTLQKMGGGTLSVVEIEPNRVAACHARLSALPIPDVKWHVLHNDVFQAIAALPSEGVDFVWLDDNHEHAHVDFELGALLPKIRPGGIIAGHDVCGSFDLRREFVKHGGYALDLPRLAAAGGLGILQTSGEV